MMTRYLLLFASLFFLLNCQNNSPEQVLYFHQVPSLRSGISFINEINEDEKYNALDYEYLYNGAGVGIADFDLNGYPDLFFSANMQSSRLYLNQGDWQFQEETISAGVETSNWCTGVSIVDINQDGYPDIHVATVHNADFKQTPNLFFINAGNGTGTATFMEKAADMGLVDSSYTMQVVWLDYDLDGDLDLFQANNSMESYPRNAPFGQAKDGSGRSTDRLYRNNGIMENGLPYFTDVSSQAGIQIEGWSLGVRVMDINQDGYPDIYVANDFMSNDLLYINNQDGTFENKISEFFKHQSHNSMGVDIADLNNDQAMDLVVLDMLPEDNLRRKTMFDQIPFDRFKASLRKGYEPQFVRNVLQANNGAGKFSDIAYYAGIASTDWSWSPLLADFDNDGLRDIYITNGYKKDVTDLDFVNYNNQASAFGTKEEKYQALIKQLAQMEGIKKSNRFFSNQSQFLFTDFTDETGLNIPSYSNGASYADLDLDGDLDLVVNNINDPAMLLDNQLDQRANYLRLKLGPDTKSFGAKVWLYHGTSIQFAEYYPQLGYLSSMEPIIHFGLDTLQKIDSLKIYWPNGMIQLEYGLSSNQVLKYQAPMANQASSSMREEKLVTPDLTLFNQIEVTDYLHQEKPFDDFKRWPLRFRGHSNNGPALATGDVNGDQLEDLFIGGTTQSNGQSYIQLANGEFERHKLNDEEGRLSEDVHVVLFDGDLDGDLDLYCVSGSSEHFSKPELYQDRYYENDGAGNFSARKEVIPTIQSAGACVKTLDFDGDGDQDLFRAGRIDPNHYPRPPRSYLLENDKGFFKDVTSQSPQLLQPGMITDVLATDLNSDGWTDLIVVGEWMPIQIYYNYNGIFKLDESNNGLTKSNGWWNCIEGADFDQDGDIDFVAGNWGLNNPFTAKKNEPISIYHKDYDQNDTREAIFTYFNQGEEYIFHPRGTLTSQLPGLKNIFTDYRSYGLATFKQVFGNYQFKASEIFRTYELASLYIENIGSGKFRCRQLPNALQWSPILDFQLVDLNQDQQMDILAVGNFHQIEILSGWYNASNGHCLFGNGDGTFNIQSQLTTGFNVPTVATSIEQLSGQNGHPIFVVGNQEGKLDGFQYTNRKLFR